MDQRNDFLIAARAMMAKVIELVLLFAGKRERPRPMCPRETKGCDSHLRASCSEFQLKSIRLLGLSSLAETALVTVRREGRIC